MLCCAVLCCAVLCCAVLCQSCAVLVYVCCAGMLGAVSCCYVLRPDLLSYAPYTAALAWLHKLKPCNFSACKAVATMENALQADVESESTF